MDKYKNFSKEDFLQDEFFNQWVKDKFSKDAELWENWLIYNPEKRELVDECKDILSAFNVPPNNLPEDFFTRLKDRIDSTISNESKNKTSTFFIGNWLKMVAVLLGLLITVWLLFPSPNRDFISYYSNYGEVKKIILPDGSAAVLNANSSMKYKESNDKRYREVWLRGEGFFSIKHIDNKEKVPVKFLVHTKDIDVEVLGTEFNVTSVDGNETKVLLTKGKVSLSTGEKRTHIIDMIPGEQVLFDNKTRRFNVNKVDPGAFVAWMDHKFILEKTTLEDVAKELYRYYGKPVAIEDPEMLKQRLSGTLELQDEETLIKTLSVLLGVPVIGNDQQIIIHSKQNS